MPPAAGLEREDNFWGRGPPGDRPGGTRGAIAYTRAAAGIAIFGEPVMFIRKLFRPFIAGLVAALPLAFTVAILIWAVNFIQGFLGPHSAFGRLLGSIGLRFVTSEIIAYLIGVFVTLVLIYLLGVVVEAGMKNRLNAMLTGILGRVPLVSTIYRASKQLAQMLERNDRADVKAMSPVLCYLGGDGGTAVLALMPNPERVSLEGRDYHAVLIPTAPVPFGGAILYVPVEWVKPVDFAFDGLLNVYMSMGGTSPDYLGTAGRSTPGRAESSGRAEPS